MKFALMSVPAMINGTQGVIEGECCYHMLRIPDRSVDLIATDPPYNSGMTWAKEGREFVDKFPSTKEYVEWLRPRVEQMHRILTDTGTIYLQCSVYEPYIADGRMTEQDLIDRIARGKMAEDWWYEGFEPVVSNHTQYVGYPTQKPVSLYERIVAVSSDVDNLVFDPFCGSGTTLVAAANLGRRFLGIDMNAEAVQIARNRIEEATRQGRLGL